MTLLERFAAYHNLKIDGNEIRLATGKFCEATRPSGQAMLNFLANDGTEMLCDPFEMHPAARVLIESQLAPKCGLAL